MTWTSSEHSYGRGAQLLHWLAALLILAMIPIGLVMVRLDPGDAQTGLYRFHVALGLAVATLTLVRIAWRLVDRRPAPLPNMPRWRLRLFEAVHILLYGGVAVLAISGIAMLLGSDLGITPASVDPTEIDRDLAPRSAHSAVSKIFSALLVAHVGGAISYQITKGDTLGRMGLRRPGSAHPA